MLEHKDDLHKMHMLSYFYFFFLAQRGERLYCKISCTVFDVYLVRVNLAWAGDANAVVFIPPVFSPLIRGCKE
jgi:hypothetical protein